MNDIIENIKVLRDEATVLRPIYTPHNEQAKALVTMVHQSLDLPQDRPSSVTKQQAVVASFLATAQRVFGGDKGAIAMSSTKKWWSLYPHAGHTIGTQVQNALVKGEYITQMEGSGRTHVYKDEDDKWRSIGIMRTFALNDSIMHLDGFTEAEFVETGLPTVLVSIEEDPTTKYARKKNNRTKPKLDLKTMKSRFGRDYGIASKQVENLNTFWTQHPLAFPPLANGVKRYAACATRTFHDERLDSGGRFYGAWTGLGSDYRLECTIDDEPVAEIDLNASQPTLFSSMMGKKMKITGMWDDLYSHVLEQVDLSGLNIKDEDHKTRRGKIKQVTVELIGLGRHDKRAASPESDYTFLLGEYARYRNALVSVVPALLLLNQEYHKGSGYISYHEAQMMLHTLETLRNMDIPAYPIHDCLLVKESDVKKAMDVYRDTIRSYIKEFGKGDIDIVVPVSIERKNKDKIREFGYYPNC